METREWNGVIRLDRGRRRGTGRVWDLIRFWDLLRLAWHTRRTRRQLAEMDDRMLSDIGIGRAEAYEETKRTAWDTGPRPR